MEQLSTYQNQYSIQYKIFQEPAAGFGADFEHLAVTLALFSDPERIYLLRLAETAGLMLTVYNGACWGEPAATAHYAQMAGHKIIIEQLKTWRQADTMELIL